MLRLRYDTPEDFKRIVLQDFDGFLRDHAANERKVSASAMTLVTHHPERTELVEALVDLAQEELTHFRQVYELLRARGQPLGLDGPDPYMSKLRNSLRRRDMDEYLLDRLVLFAIVEARGCERFALVADALREPELKAFYDELVRSESRHHATYLRLAKLYFPAEAVDTRLDELLRIEAEVVAALPLRAALH